VYEIDEIRDQFAILFTNTPAHPSPRQDPDIAESDRLRRRIAELEQVVREMRQRQPQRVSAPSFPPFASVDPIEVNAERPHHYNKRRVVVDRFARFKIDEAAMAAVASAAEAAGEMPGGRRSRRSSGEGSRKTSSTDDSGSGVTKDYGTEPYATYLLPGEEMVHDKVGRKTFLGASAGRSMLRKVGTRRQALLMTAT